LRGAGLVVLAADGVGHGKAMVAAVVVAMLAVIRWLRQGRQARRRRADSLCWGLQAAEHAVPGLGRQEVGRS